MVVGIECAGLVLATLPLFIELAKAYANGAETVADVAIASRRDSKLQEFYDHFWWETVELNHKLRRIVDVLPNLAQDRKLHLSSASHLQQWTKQPDIESALRDYFATTDDYNTFTHVMTKLVSLLAQLIKDNTIHISTEDADQIFMYKKLKQFASDKESNQTSSGFRERFRFWKKEKHRSKCLRELRIWNRRLGCLIENAGSGSLTTTTSQSNSLKIVGTHNHRVPSVRLRRLSQLLYRALSQYWDCCVVRHEAKVCLKLQDDNTNGDENAEFSFLVSYDSNRGNQWTWQEGYVVVHSGRSGIFDDREELRKICDAFEISCKNQQLRLLVEDLNSCQKLWRLRSQPQSLHIIDQLPAESLKNLIQSRTAMSLHDKRRLALIFSHSLLQYHDSEWLGSEWGKRSISFFYKSQDELDLQRPYISTHFNEQPPVTGPNMTRFHPNPSILALGILLIEIELGKPIEDCRLANDAININTDMIVADRIMVSMNQCSNPYREAIKACLEIPWIPAGRKVCLEDEDTRQGLYWHVINPLEKELEYMFPKGRRS